MESSRLASGLGCAYLVITLALSITFGVIMIMYTSSLIPNDLITNFSMTETVKNWNLQPYTSVSLPQYDGECNPKPQKTSTTTTTASTGASAGASSSSGSQQSQSDPEPEYEDFLYRAWYGTGLGCNCIKGHSKDLPNPSVDHSMLWGRVCTWTELQSGCETIPELTIRKMEPFPMFKTCAKRGGTKFLEVIRPDPITEKCPVDTFPCSPMTDAQNTVCMSQADIDADKCPITDIVILQDKKELDGLAPGYTKLMNETTKMYFAYSKINTNNLPLTNVTLIQGQPCANQSVEISDNVLVAAETSKGFYFFEKMKFDNCPVDTETGLTFDNRYTEAMQGSIPLRTTDWDVQEADGTLKILFSLPYYNNTWNVPNPNVKKDVKLKPWVRPTISWNLECEESLTRSKALEFLEISYQSLSHSFSGNSEHLGRQKRSNLENFVIITIVHTSLQCVLALAALILFLAVGPKLFVQRCTKIFTALIFFAALMEGITFAAFTSQMFKSATFNEGQFQKFKQSGVDGCGDDVISAFIDTTAKKVDMQLQMEFYRDLSYMAIGWVLFYPLTVAIFYCHACQKRRNTKVGGAQQNQTKIKASTHVVA